MNVGFLGTNLRKRVHTNRIAARYAALRRVWPSLTEQEAKGIARVMEKWARLAERGNT